MSSDMIPGYAAASSTRVLGLVVDVYPRISALLQPVRRSLVGVSHSRSFARLTPLICGSGSASWILRPGYWGARVTQPELRGWGWWWFWGRGWWGARFTEPELRCWG